MPCEGELLQAYTLLLNSTLLLLSSWDGHLVPGQFNSTWEYPVETQTMILTHQLTFPPSMSSYVLELTIDTDIPPGFTVSSSQRIAEGDTIQIFTPTESPSDLGRIAVTVGNNSLSAVVYLRYNVTNNLALTGEPTATTIPNYVGRHNLSTTVTIVPVNLTLPVALENCPIESRYSIGGSENDSCVVCLLNEGEAEMTTSSELEVILKGPDLSINVSVVGGVEVYRVGDTVRFLVEIGHGPYSIEAANLSISIQTSGPLMNISDVTLNSMTPAYSVESSRVSVSPSGIFLTNHSITLSGQFKLAAAVLADTPFIITAGVEWWSTSEVWGYRYHETAETSIPMESSWLSSSASAATVPSQWSNMETASYAVTVDLPFGVLPDLALEFELTGENADMIQFTGSQAYFSSTGANSPPYLEDPSLTNITDASGFRFVFRPKRAVVATTVVKRSLGNVVFPPQPGATANLTILVNMALGSAQTYSPLSANVSLSTTSARLLLSSFASITGPPAVNIIFGKDIAISDNTRNPPILHVTLFANHSTSSTGSAFGMIVLDETAGSIIGSPNLTLTSTRANFSTVVSGDPLFANFSELQVGEALKIEYDLEPYDSLPDGETHLFTNLSFFSSPPPWLPTAGFVISTHNSCVVRETICETVFYVDEGLTALLVIIGLIIGALLTVGGMYYCFIVLPKKGLTEDQYKERGNASLLSLGIDQLDSAAKLPIPRPFEETSWKTGLMQIFCAKDRNTTRQQLGYYMIERAMELDSLHESRVRSLQILMLSVLSYSLTASQDLPRDVVDRNLAKLRKNVADKCKSVSSAEQQRYAVFNGQCKAKTQKKLGSVLRSRNHRLRQLDADEDLTTEDRVTISKQIGDEFCQNCQLVYYECDLQALEEKEKVRKESNIQRRYVVSDASRECLTNIIQEGKQGQEQANWLHAEHSKLQQANEHLFKSVCDMGVRCHRLTGRRRELLCQLLESDETASRDTITSIRTHATGLIRKMIKSELLTKTEARGFQRDVREKMDKLLSTVGDKRLKEQKAFYTAADKEHRDRVAQSERQQEAEITELERIVLQRAVSEPVDPGTAGEEVAAVIRRQMGDMVTVLATIDSDQSQKLQRLRSGLSDEVVTKVKAVGENITAQMVSEGLEPKRARLITSKHNKQLVALEERCQSEKSALMQTLEQLSQGGLSPDSLSHNGQGFSQAKRDQFMQSLVCNQLVLAEAERHSVQSHAASHAALTESSLVSETFTRRKVIDRKLAALRHQLLSDLDETLTATLNEAEMKEWESGSILVRYAAQREAILELVGSTDQGENEGEGGEMSEEISTDVRAQGGVDVRRQEEEATTKITTGQFGKGAQASLLERQQEALEELLRHLLADCIAREVLSDIETQQFLRQHHVEKLQLKETLRQEKAVREQELKSYLQGSISQKERMFLTNQQGELQSQFSQSEKLLSASVHKVAFIKKQKIDFEKFRFRIEKEITQEIEEFERQQLQKNMQLSLEMDVRLIAGFLHVSQVGIHELRQAVGLLVPDFKPETQQQLWTALATSQNGQHLPEKGDLGSQLLLRLRHASQGGREDSPLPPPGQEKPKKKKNFQLKKSRKVHDEGQQYELPAVKSRPPR